MVESLSSDGLNLDRSSTEVVALEVGQNVMLTGNNVEVINTNHPAGSPEIALWTTSTEQSSTFQTSWTNSNGATASSPTTPSTPLNTPLSSSSATPQCTAHSSLRGAQARQPSFQTPPARTPVGARSSSGQPSWTPQWRTEAKYSGSKLRGNQVTISLKWPSSLCKLGIPFQPFLKPVIIMVHHHLIGFSTNVKRWFDCLIFWCQDKFLDVFFCRSACECLAQSCSNFTV